MEFAPLSLAFQHEYRALLAKTPEKASDYSFVNLWAWHGHRGYELAEAHGLGWIRLSRPEAVLWAPVGDWTAVDWQRLLPEEFPEGAVFDRVPSSLVSLWEQALPGQIQSEPERSEWEYVYSLQDLVDLPGNRFHKKKNLLNQFLKSADWSFEPLGPETIREAMSLQEDWCTWRDCAGSEGLAAENEAITRVFSAWEVLVGLLGGVIRVDGKIASYTVAEDFGEETLVIHFEKGNPAFKGIYQAINQVFLERMGSGFAWVNREQDMGDEGLRQAKMSYNPARFVEKYRVRLLESRGGIEQK
jgi:hypothetical protein